LAEAKARRDRGFDIRLQFSHSWLGGQVADRRMATSETAARIVRNQMQQGDRMQGKKKTASAYFTARADHKRKVSVHFHSRHLKCP